MRVLVCGSRWWIDREYLYEQLDKFHEKVPITTLIEGCATGADSQAGDWARSRGVEVAPFPAKWQEYHKAAGPIRNQQMIDEGKPQFGIAFHDDLANSKGTKDMTQRLSKHNIPWVVLKGRDK